MRNRFEELRTKMGYSQEGMASSAGMKQAQWSRWEKKPPEALGHLKALVQRHSVNAEWLLGLSDEFDRPTPPDKPMASAVKEILAALEGVSDDGRDDALALVEFVAERDRRRQENVKVNEFLLGIIEAQGGPAAIDQLLATLDSPLPDSAKRDWLLAWFRQHFAHE